MEIAVLALTLVNIAFGAGTLWHVIDLAAEWGQFREKVQNIERRVTGLEKHVFDK